MIEKAYDDIVAKDGRPERVGRRGLHLFEALRHAVKN